jgi:3-hydroxyacyl-CoA dehydrogenase/enoyl-CoA hydratase/3-hydroxybutyryl-CoA epimerase
MNKSLGKTIDTGDVSFQTIQYRVTDKGVAFIAIDVPGRDVNVLTPQLHVELGEAAARLATDDSASGAVLYSGKQAFMAGGDLKRIVRYYEMDRTASDAYEKSRAFSQSLRQLETCGKPVAVAINGAALGGGLEMALACHYRVVVDDDEIMLGLPEVTLGLIPGAGGTQRLPRLIGLDKAVSLILDGTTISPARALELGIVDELSAADELLNAAERWVIEHGRADQPWDRRGFRIPGGSKLNDMNVGRLFQIQTAKVGAKYRHNYPAPIAALRALFNGTTVNSIDQGLRIESREFSALTRNPVARNIIRTLFINKRERKFRKQDTDLGLVDLCRQTCADEAQRMLDQGISRALIRNAAWAAGMRDHPTGLETAESELLPEQGGFNFDQLKQRLLAIQSLAAAELWANEELDPVTADLSTVLGGGFPSYTGGVMSHISTIGLPEFIALCDEFADEFGDHFRPSDALRARSDAKRSIYQDR